MSTGAAILPVLWTPDRPDVCACAGSYRPKLNDKGKLVKCREPAWRMAEQTRDPGCLQEQHRAMAARYELDYHHAGDSRKGNAGYPDVHIWAGQRRGSVFIELKKMGCNPTPVQVARMASLAAASHLVYLCRPCCLLTGTVDRIMARLAHVEPRGEYVQPAATASVLPVPPELAAPARPAPAPRRARPEPPLPGVDPPADIPGAVGYVVSMSAAAADYPAVTQLEAWLRAAGIPPTFVPFPMRLVAGDALVVVQVRVGDGRVWRAAPTVSPFPVRLVERLGADVIAGPAHFLMELIEHAVPSCELPDRPVSRAS